MVETSTLTPHQELVNKLQTGHPQRQLLEVLKRVEILEQIVNKPKAPKTSRAEILAKARAAKKAKNGKVS